MKVSALFCVVLPSSAGRGLVSSWYLAQGTLANEKRGKTCRKNKMDV
jgi:hypothetical protein